MDMLRSEGLIVLLIFVQLILPACSLVTDFDENVEEIRATANALETSLQNSIQLMETGQAMLTNIEGSSAGQTAQAVATGFKESGYVETAKSLAEEKGPQMLQTAEFFTTEQIPKLLITAQIIATRIPGSSNLPVMQGKKSNYSESPTAVSYRIEISCADVVEFYEKEMTKSGWSLIASDSVKNQDGAIFHYEKFKQRAVLTINFDTDTGTTIVNIIIQDG